MGTLTDAQKDILLNSGFMLSEISTFDNAKTSDGKFQNLDFNSKTFQGMIIARRGWVTKARASGYNNQEIRSMVKSLYDNKRSKFTPWDFLKIEYQPTTRGMTDMEFENKLKTRSMIRSKLVNKSGISYGKKLKDEFAKRENQAWNRKNDI
jgi:hypothetical protein